MVAQRDEKGRFIKGTEAGPGRPPRETEQYFKDLFRGSVSDDDFRAAVAALVKEAKRGNTAALKLLFDYLMGPPLQKIAPTTPDGENPYMNISAEQLIELARRIAHAGDATN